MTVQAEPEAPPPLRGRAAFLTCYYDVHPTYRLIARWFLIWALTVFAFRASWASLVVTSNGGGLGAYVWTVPGAAVLAAIGVARHHRTELPIHDRQTDIIVGGMGLILAVLIEGVLVPRYALYFYLLRLDLLAMWWFVLSCCIVLFGLRPVMRFAYVWGLLLLVFSLPYHLAVIALGGGTFAAGGAALIIAGIGSGIASGRTLRQGLIGAVLAVVLGFAILVFIDRVFHDAPLQVHQEVPALTAMSLVGLTLYVVRRRGKPMQLLDRKVEPLASNQVWSAVPLVVGVAIVLAYLPLPSQLPRAPAPSPRTLVSGQPLITPPGWATQDGQEYRDVKRLYGGDAVLVRQKMVADLGSFRWDKLSRPRTLVVDSLISHHPFSFAVYPGRVLYGLTGSRFSPVHPVDLGMGVTGEIASVVDDKLLITWNALQFAWGDERTAQRVTVFAVDDHRPDAPFPTPLGNVTSSVGTLLTLLFRGNSVLDVKSPTFKDADLLTEFGRALVRAQYPGGAQ